MIALDNAAETIGAVRTELERRLTERFTRDGYRPTPDTPVPRVAALGVADLLDWQLAAGREPAGPRPEHRDATVHVTAQAVLVGPTGGSAVGPTGGPTTGPVGSGACGHCLAIRWQRLRPPHERDAVETGRAARAAGCWPILSEHLIDAVWSCYRSILLEPRAAGTHSRVTRIDLRTLAVTTEPLLAEPRCPSCGSTRQPPSDLELTTRTKPGPAEYRLRRIAEYDLPGAALANGVCGALGRAATRSLGSPTTAPVTGTGFARGPAGLHELGWSGQANSFADSTRLAYLEGLERYAGTMRRRPGLLVDSYANLGDRALDPRECGTYAPSEYETVDRLVPFDPDKPIPWVSGYSLRDHRPVLVPAETAYYGWDGAAELFVFECSNGCASGSCLEEAILFGLFELIERDAFLLAWYGGADLTELDTGTVGPAARAMIDRALLQGYDVRLFDNRIDLLVPVVTGVAIRRDGGPGLLSFAAGASLDPRAAVDAALGEILTYIPSMPRQVSTRRGELEKMAADYSLVRGLHDHPGLFALPEMAEQARHYLRPADPKPMADVYRSWERARPATTDLSDDVRFCTAELARAGFDVIVVDQTAPEQRAAGLSNVKVIVPGLLPIDFGWSRQRALRLPRMYTALRRAGLRETELTEADLHMVPHPFP